MFFKYLLLLALLQIVVTIATVEMPKEYKVLADCQLAYNCQQYYKKNAEKYYACSQGCNFLLTGVKCDQECEKDKERSQEYKEMCKNICNKKPVEQEVEKPKQQPQEKPKQSIVDVVGALKNEDIFDKLFNSIPTLLKGEPQVQAGSSVVEIKPLNDDDDDSNSSSEESKENQQPKESSSEEDEETIKSNIKIVDPSNVLDEEGHGFSPFNLIRFISRAMEMAKTKFGTKEPGSFIYSVKIENGNLVENIQKQPAGEDDLVKLLDAVKEDDDKLPLYYRLPAGSKGRPLPLGRPIVEKIDEPIFPYGSPHILRECRPISFHFKTLCADINNFFNCASMRTGLPHWFFMSLIILSSFFMIWLGLCILSMTRRMRRQERVIYMEEDKVPLYEDFVIEKKSPPPSYEQAEPLPEKVKFESV